MRKLDKEFCAQIAELSQRMTDRDVEYEKLRRQWVRLSDDHKALELQVAVMRNEPLPPPSGKRQTSPVPTGLVNEFLRDTSLYPLYSKRHSHGRLTDLTSS